MAKELIDFLDLIGGDPDSKNEVLDFDSEDADPAEDDGTAEPSLAALERHRSHYSVGDQADWAAGNRDDRDHEHDDAEPDEDDEPSLGWSDDETIFGNYAGTFGVDNEVDDYEDRRVT